VVSSSVLKDRAQRGLAVGFLEMSRDESAEAMLAGLHQSEGFDRSLKVSIQNLPTLKKAAFVSAALLLIV
jgi:hypothetical protein